jgi:hypothetical protein
MRFDRALTFLTYATVAWAFTMLVLFGELGVMPSVIGGVGLLGAALAGRLGFRLPDRVWLLLSLAALSGALYGWFALRLYFDSVVYLFLYLEANKLCTAKNHRDLLQIYGLTFFQVLAAAVSTASVAFAPALLLYLFLMLGALITITVRREAELAFQRPKRKLEGIRPLVRLSRLEKQRTAELMATQWLDSAALRRLSFGLVFVVIIGGTLFFLIPRLQGQAINFGLAPTSGGTSISGFTDSVTFGELGTIQTDSTIAMRVLPGSTFPLQLGYPTIDVLRLRGTALDFYDGTRWGKSETVQRRMRTSDRRRAHSFTPDRAFNTPAAIHSVRIQMEPNRKGFLFGPDRTAHFSFEEDLVLLVDEIAQSVQVLTPKSTTLQYTTEMRVLDPAALDRLPQNELSRLAEEARAAVDSLLDVRQWGRGDNSIPRNQERREELAREIFLQLPPHPDIETVRTLAQEWITDATSPRDIADRLQHRLRNYFSYSLDVPFSSRQDHLTHFLTEAKQGHCEYFATAMTLMLRTQGIPARIVNGYATDEWISGGSYYIVRQEHAHSWVEAWFPAAGWITYDPTPSSGIGNNRLPNTFYRQLTQWYDMVKFFWYERVIDYGAQDQAFIFFNFFRVLDRSSRIGGALGDSVREAMEGRSFAGGFLLYGVIALAGVGLWLFVQRFKLMRERRKGQLRDGADFSPIADYQAILDLLGKTAPRGSGATAREYARQVVSQRTDLADLIPLTERYYQTRFNEAPWQREDSDRAKALLRLIQNPPKHPAPTGAQR